MSQAMLQEMKTAHTHLLTGLGVGRNTTLPKGNYTRIILCGMGGSALAAELIKDYVAAHISFQTCHEYALPVGVDYVHTLVIASSYSGNTEETIAALRDAQQKGCDVVVMAHGGMLGAIAKEEGLPYFEVPSAIQPRCAIGFGMGILLGMLEQLQIIENHTVLLQETEAFLLQEIDSLEEQAKEYAKKIAGTVPVIYAGSGKASLARITKIHCNENAKTQSFFAELPEMNHNEMVGYTNLVMKPTILLIRSKDDHPRVTLRMDTMKKVLGERGIPFLDIVLKGDSWLAETYYGLMFAYLMSYYLALEYGVDPTPVDMVEEFKKLLV